MGIEAELRRMKLDLPSVHKPVGRYVPAKRVGDLLFVSGQGPNRDGVQMYTGKVGAEVSIEEGHAAAQLCALNSLAAAKSVLGTLDLVQEVVQVTGFVSSSEDFFDQPKVVDGASGLFLELLGAAGQHARASIGVCSLPGNKPVEILVVLRIAK